MIRAIAIYFVFWTITWTAMLADFQYMADNYGNACRDYRSQLAGTMGAALIPVVPWIITPFMTGFYEHGFQVFPLKRCKKNG